MNAFNASPSDPAQDAPDLQIGSATTVVVALVGARPLDGLELVLLPAPDAGLLYGVGCGWDWIKAARLGSGVGAVKNESQSAPNHLVGRGGNAGRFADAYGERPW